LEFVPPPISTALAVTLVRFDDGTIELRVSWFCEALAICAPVPCTLLPAAQVAVALFGEVEFIADCVLTSVSPAGGDAQIA
jgi:hypothetical protein